MANDDNGKTFSLEINWRKMQATLFEAKWKSEISKRCVENAKRS